MVLPVPEPDEHTEPFWLSGADGTLRVRRCPSCGRLAHPSLAVCPSCLVPTEPAAVSGGATVVALTVAHHHGDAGAATAPPTIAVVALDDDPAVRLTTAIVDAPPDGVGIGDHVTARFLERGRWWVPVFAPVAGDRVDVAGLVDLPATGRRPRGRVPADRFEHRVALTGVGRSAVGRRLMRAPIELAVDAARAAVADAGLTWPEIDGLSTYPGALGGTGLSEGGIPTLEEALRINPVWHNGAMEMPGQGGAVVAAMLAVASGLCRHVLCVRTVWEATHSALSRQRAAEGPAVAGVPVARGDAQWRHPFGALSPASWLALNASHYLHRFGAGRETLGWIALNARQHAAGNPRAVYRDPMTMDDYLGARLISTPFGLFDCDVPCDGAIAVVVSARETAVDRRVPPVLVDAVGTEVTERQSWDQGTLTHEPNVFGPAHHLWSRTSLTRSDVDVALLYDGFTFNCVSWIEALGFCGIGEAKDFVDGGHRISLAGELPLNPHGGQLSAGRTHGFGFIEEAILQLRGEAEGRQVAGAEVAVVSTGGGTPGSCFLLTRGPGA